jgi:hypothetical protein
MIKNTITASLLCCIIFFTGCGKDYREVIDAPEQKFYQGQQLEAARMLLKHVNKKGRDQLVFLMEAGYLLHMATRYKDSNKVLLKAAELAKIKPISITKQVAALLVNQTKTNYRGEDFEKVLVHMILGINFIMLNNYDSAAVEFKAVNQELLRIKSEDGTARYKQNLMAKYLTAIAHEIIADRDNSEEDREYAEVEYRQIIKLKPTLSMARRDLARLQVKNRDEGELVVIFQAGRSPVKVSRGKLLSDPAMNGLITASVNSRNLAAGVSIGGILATMKLAENPIPQFKRRSNKTKNLLISVQGQQATTTMLENTEYTAIKTLEDDYNRLKGKFVASIVTKAIVSIAAGIAAREATKAAGGGSALSAFVGLVAGSGTGAALFASIRPDLRCWHTLPANFQLARMRLNPGEYTVNVDYIGHNGAKLQNQKVNVKIKKKGKYFLNIRTTE